MKRSKLNISDFQLMNYPIESNQKVKYLESIIFRYETVFNKSVSQIRRKIEYALQTLKSYHCSCVLKGVLYMAEPSIRQPPKSLGRFLMHCKKCASFRCADMLKHASDIAMDLVNLNDPSNVAKTIQCPVPKGVERCA